MRGQAIRLPGRGSFRLCRGTANRNPALEQTIRPIDVLELFFCGGRHRSHPGGGASPTPWRLRKPPGRRPGRFQQVERGTQFGWRLVLALAAPGCRPPAPARKKGRAAIRVEPPGARKRPSARTAAARNCRSAAPARSRSAPCLCNSPRRRCRRTHRANQNQWNSRRVRSRGARYRPASLAAGMPRRRIGAVI